ncbi:HlyD family efflux transporter periplasmic adaptor subunit [Neobacillus terrae]|uniref:HlyD family efflux transporter periplasmic adaptor subunit n=1 Tax=Neobacillus terrae TaxID=3034837 RepID=UPI00140C1851|nr:HlyD family efflux transporter periplasmic adaptor subunit [Neobacillus terrae]NHM32556.1 HlyD family secretion protein [Neobacillus terrae]
MSKGSLILTNIIGLVVIVALIAAGAFFYYENENYVKTDDAVVSADMLQVVAPASGLLTEWDVKEGNTVAKKDALGSVSDGKESLPVNSMMSGKIIKNEAKANQMVQAGQVLAQTADMDHLYITANIKESDLKSISVGSSVDITVDGDSDVTFDGKVEEIGYATNSVFSALPSQNSSGSYTKVTQKVPVKILIENPSETVLPGMNAEVKISI